MLKHSFRINIFNLSLKNDGQLWAEYYLIIAED